jgi:uncharacterized Zn finger protein (UPF0148 family)
LSGTDHPPLALPAAGPRVPDLVPAAPAGAVGAASSGHCPKCRRPRRDGEAACARCGLTASRFAAWAAAAADQLAAAPPELERAWAACLAAWQEDAPHEALFDVAAQLEQLPLAARRYREALEARPGDAVAPRRLAQIAFLLENAARAEVRAQASPRASLLVWLGGYLVASLLLLTVVWAAVLAVRRYG